MHDAVEDLQEQNAVESRTVGRLHLLLVIVIEGAVAGDVIVLFRVGIQRVEVVIETAVDSWRVERVVEEEKHVPFV